MRARLSTFSGDVIVSFPARQRRAVFISKQAEGAWLVLAFDHGWILGSRAEAETDARWLSANLDLPVRVLS
ncbi:MAG: hypothetical protein ACJ8F3_08710 [Xanthobacteraceae bacterium]